MRLPRILSLFAILLLPVLSFGQKKEIVELQRDVALLQDQVRNLERLLNERTTQMNVLLQQSIDAGNKTNTSLAVLSNNLTRDLSAQVKETVGPVSGISGRVDQMSQDFRALQETVNELLARMSKMDQKLTDIKNAQTTLAAPPAAPAPTSPTPNGPPAGMSAESLYQNAQRDYSGGNIDLAMQEFQDYLKYFGQTDLAPNAQYYIGDIYYRKGDFDNAVKSFDIVLENYGDNNKLPDARYMKGMSLIKSGQRTAAAAEFRELVKRYPTHPLAAKAKDQLKSLGLSPTAPPAASRKKR